jgi:hypothetical protein
MPSYYRLRLMRRCFRDPGSRATYPRILAGPAAVEMRGPLVLATFHIGVPTALRGFLERLPGELLTLFNTDGVAPEELNAIDLLSGEAGRASALKRAVETLRAGGFVMTVVDGSGDSTVESVLFSRRVQLPRGTFAMARIAGAPILPVAARWRGRGIEIETGAQIQPGAEAEMADALMRWLERYLSAHPDQALVPIINLLRRAPLVDGVLAEHRAQERVPDLSVVGAWDRLRREHADATRREAERRGDAPRDLGADPLG